MSYTHFTITERSKIEVYLELGYSIRQIGRKLGGHSSSVSRELKRNPDYQAERAQENYKQRKANCGAYIKLTPSLKSVLQEKLNHTWSLEQIVGSLFPYSLSFKTIYRWLVYRLVGTAIGSLVLRQKGKSQPPKEIRGRLNIGTTISKRPKDVRKLTTFVHWKLDTVVSRRGEAKECVATVFERQARW